MNNKPSLRVATLTKVQALDSIVFLSQRSSPTKQLSNQIHSQNQYIGGLSQNFSNKYKSSFSTAQNITVPSMDKKQLTGQNSSIASMEQLRANARSGSDYQSNTKNNFVNSNGTYEDNIPLKQKYPKLNLKSDEFSSLVKQLYSPGKKNITPIAKRPNNILSVGSSPTYQQNKLRQYDSNSLLYNLPKSQSQAKMSTLQTDHYQPKSTTFRKDFAMLNSPITDIRQEKGFKRRSNHLNSTPQSVVDGNRPALIQDGFFEDQKQNNKINPQTTRSILTRSITTTSQQPDSNTQSNKNILSQSKFKQQQPSATLANLQKLNAQFQDQRQKSKETVRQILNDDLDKVLSYNSPKQKPPVNPLDQFVSQVKIGQNNFRQQTTIKSKPKEIPIQQKLMEQMKQINQTINSNNKPQEQVKKEQAPVVVGVPVVVQKEPHRSYPQNRTLQVYYMTKMTLFQTQECEQNLFAQIFRDHFVQSYHALGFCNVLAPQNLEVVKSKTVFLARRPTLFNKTIVLDLDETLIHCNENTNIPADIILPIEFPNGEIINAGINVRPNVDYLLSQLTSLCEVIVFTASHSCYANKVIDHIDPSRKLIHHRLFRDSCVTTEEVLYNYIYEGVHIKDLRIFGDRDLKDVVLVDNAAYSYGFQLDNGIPIIPFYDNKKDTELLDLLVYLKTLLTVPDVRQINRRTFRMHEYAISSTLENALVKICSDQR